MTSVSVLLAHSYYRERGGEDVVFEDEAALLRAHGHRVEVLTRHNDDVRETTAPARLRLAAASVWSRTAQRDVAETLRRTGVDVAHFHNTLPLLSPSVYEACARAGVPVVQTLHNYRLSCVNGLFFRDGAPCEDCLGRRVAWPGVQHACYRGSRAQSAAVAASVAVNRTLGSYGKVALFLALSEFARSKFVAAGLPADRVAVKPNFVAPDPGARPADVTGDYLLFVGRLSREKGLLTLLDAAQRLADVPVLVVGDGPVRPQVEQAIADRGIGNVQLLGRQPSAEVLRLMHGARVVVVPSESYETFGRTIIEAYACGVPVVASDIGALSELVSDGVTGRTFPPGDADGLTAALSALWRSPSDAAAMGRNGRKRYEADFTAARNYAALLQAYQRVLAR